MTATALALYVRALVVLFGVRSWVQHRRTGSAGFHGISGTPVDAGWWGGVLFVVAMVAGLAGPLLAVTGTLPTDSPVDLQVVGLVVALAGFAATLAGMGASWRIGVHPGERTELVTTGVFAHVRNPIFTAMAAAQAGVVLMVQPRPWSSRCSPFTRAGRPGKASSSRTMTMTTTDRRAR